MVSVRYLEIRSIVEYPKRIEYDECQKQAEEGQKDVTKADIHGRGVATGPELPTKPVTELQVRTNANR